MKENDQLLNYKTLELIRKNDIESLNTLYKSNPSIKENKILHIAVMFGNLETVEYIIKELKVNINEVDSKENNTALHIACKLGRIDVISLLLRYKIDDLYKNVENKDCVDLAKNEEVRDIVVSDRNEYVLKVYSMFNHFLGSPNRDNIIDILKFFLSMEELQKIPNFNIENIQKIPNFNIENIQKIIFDDIEDGMPYCKEINLFRSNLLDINYLHPYSKQTSLHLASIIGDIYLIKLLLSLGSSPFIRDKDGKAPIDYAKTKTVKEVLSSSNEETIKLVNGSTDKNNDDSSVGMGPKFEGFLLKWTNYKNGYQQRYFVLENGTLSYYLDSQTKSRDFCRGYLHLSNCILKIDSKDQHKFELHLKTDNFNSSKGGGWIKSNNNDGAYFLKAKILAEAKQWIVAITQSVHWLETQPKPISNSLINMSPNGSLSGSFKLKPVKNKSLDDQFNKNSGSPLIKSDNIFMDDSGDDVDDIDSFIIKLEGRLKIDNETEAEYLDKKFQSLEDIYTSIISNQNLESDTKDSLQYLSEINKELKIEVSNYIEKIKKQYNNDLYSAYNYIKVLKEKNDLWINTLHTMAKEHNDELQQFKKYNNIQELNTRIEAKDNESISSDDEFYDIEETEPNTNINNTQTLNNNNAQTSDDNTIFDQIKGYPLQFRIGFDKPITSPPSFSLWKLVKNAIGKDLTKMPLPVFFNEPLSMLQKNCEELEYIELLDYASIQQPSSHSLDNNGGDGSLEKTIWVAAFAISSYASTLDRTTKPFNPLLGETFEFFNRDKGYFFMSEQVSHHPPISVSQTESANYKLIIELSIDSKFWGKSLEIYPTGITHLFLNSYNSSEPIHFSWKKVTTTVNNIILGNLSIDHYGDLIVTNHNSGDVVTVTFNKPSWLGNDAHKLIGTAKNSKGVTIYELEGFWDSHLTVKRTPSTQSTNVDNSSDGFRDGKLNDLLKLQRYKHLKPTSKIATFLSVPQSPTFESVTIWKAHPYLKLNKTEKSKQRPFGLTPFSITLNQLTSELSYCLPPTDSRLRPDQRSMELMLYDDANKQKLLLEQKQRDRRNQPNYLFEPKWFKKTIINNGDDYWCLDKDKYLELRNLCINKLGNMQNCDNELLEKERIFVWNSIGIFEI